MSNLRQRRKPPTTKNQAAGPSSTPAPAQSSAQLNWRSALLFCALYAPVIVVFNPATLPNIYHALFPTRCQGLCSLDDVNKGGDDARSSCRPSDPSRLVLLRIPKTGSSTMTTLFRSRSNDKSTSVVDVGELEDFVASIPLPAGFTGSAQQGFHDPSPEATHLRMIGFYKHVAPKILLSPFQGRDRLVFHGHFRYYDWANRAVRLLPPPSAWKEKLPQFIRALYQMTPPPTTERLLESNPDGIPTITLVRSPIERLASMYYYDRHTTRTSQWRDEFVRRSGNATLEECLTDTECLEKNDLRRWCNIQTEMLCGVDPECRRRPLDREALDIAKKNARDNLLFVGTTERMDESAKVLERMLPTYLEGLGGAGSVHEKVGNVARREQSFSGKATKVLKDICALDMELYEYVDERLTERVTSCGQ